MATKYSKAPWTCDTQGLIKDAEGELIAQIFDNPDNGTQPLGEETSTFNQQLIIIAPELLRALTIAENFMSGFEDDEMQTGINLKLAVIRGAIESATKIP